MRTALIAMVLGVISMSAVADEPMRDYPFEAVAENVWVIHGPLGSPNVENQGFMNNPGIVLTAAGVVVVDPGSSRQAGEMVLRMVKQVTDAPIVATFNTHVHGDHWLGNDAIRAAYPQAPIYGHPEMIVEIEAGAGDRWVSMMSSLTEGFTDGTVVEGPNVALKHGDEVTVGATTFRMHHYGHSHTLTDLMIEVVEDGAVFLGDNAMVGRFGNMGEGTFQGNIDALNQVLKSGAKSWVPGHGVSGGSTAASDYRDYLVAVYQAAQFAFEEGLESDEVKPIALERTMAWSGWVGYEGEIGRHANQAYLEVEASEF